MDPDIEELKEKVGELTEMVKENQRMLRSVYRKSQWASVFVAVKWVLIVAISIGAFYYIQPILESTLKTYETASGILSSMKGQPAVATSSSSSFLNFLKSL